MEKKTDGSKKNNKKRQNKSQRGLALAVLIVILAAFVLLVPPEASVFGHLRDSLFRKIGIVHDTPEVDPGITQTDPSSDDVDLPVYVGEYYTALNGNVPVFPAEAYEIAGLVESGGRWKTEGTLRGVDPTKLHPFEYYGELDDLGRCTVAYGCLGLETMPAQGEERGDISSVHPSGWARGQKWERAHLIAWKLSNENANERNLVTGTHYMNNEGMRPLEEEVEHYIWGTGNHVLYLARPVFSGDELVPRGVNLMAWSVEDEGEGICFNVYCFNVTPGALIDYRTGIVTTSEQAAQEARLYVINTRSGVFHYPSCDGAKEISQRNRKEVTATRVELTSQGYTPCGACEP